MPGLLNVQNGLLRAPFERYLGVPGDCFCIKTGRLPALHDGLNDIRRQESQADQATHIAYGEPLARSDLSKRARLSGADLIEPAMCPGYGFQQRQVSLLLFDSMAIVATEQFTIPSQFFSSWHGPSAHPRGMKMLYCWPVAPGRAEVASPNGTGESGSSLTAEA
jgi:hypothetical protein